MRKILILVICLLLFYSLSYAQVDFDGLIDQLKMTMAQEEPQLPDQVYKDFLIVCIQYVCAHGLADGKYDQAYCSTGTQDYVFDDAGLTCTSHPKQGLFIKSMGIDEDEATHRSIWEVGSKDLGQKELVDPPAYQFYYIWHDSMKSYFHLFRPADGYDTVSYVRYSVPICFSGVAAFENVPVPNYFEQPIIELTLFLLYSRVKNWKQAFNSWNKFSGNFSIIRENHINKQPQKTFAPQVIED